MEEILRLKQLLSNNSKNITTSEALSIFGEQVEETTSWTHLCLTKEQYDKLDDDFDFSIFGDILISVEKEGKVDFIHCFYVENMESIKEKGLLISCSSLKDVDYIPDMGYGIYVEEGSSSYDMSDELAEFLLQRYDYEDAEIGYVEGSYIGKYIECIYGYKHEGYIVLKEDVQLKMINNIDSEYISSLARDYYEYEGM